MATAPPLMLALGRKIDKDVPGAVMSGIVGNAQHSYGYHLAPNQLGGNDYSIQLSLDKGTGVNRNYASALDISLTPAQMKMVTARLKASAIDPDDDRMKYFREFYGTLNGNTVYGLTHNSETGSWSSATSDSSHLFHVHLSFFRRYANSPAAMTAAYSLFSGDDSPMAFTKADAEALSKADVFKAPDTWLALQPKGTDENWTLDTYFQSIRDQVALARQENAASQAALLAALGALASGNGVDPKQIQAAAKAGALEALAKLKITMAAEK